MDTVRLARDMGTVAELLPDGIESVTDMPHTLFTAVNHGLRFLSFEELPSEEQPPKRIWLDPEKLTDWFDTVKKRREEQYGGGKSAGPIEDPVENAAAKSLIVGD